MSTTQRRVTIAFILLTLLAACGGSDDPDEQATIGAPNCAVSGVCK